MKSVKSLSLALVLAFSASVHAQGMEELCSNVAEQDVKMKHLIKSNSAFFEFAITDIEKSSSSERNKAALREKLFFIKNRINLSDVDFKRLSFLRCITGVW